jgi:hypothetical protein
MRSGFLYSVTALLAAASLGLAQGPAPTAGGAPASGDAPGAYGPLVPPAAAGAGDYHSAPSCLAPGAADGSAHPADHRLYASAEYLVWRMRDTVLPSFITQNTPVGSIAVSGSTTVLGSSSGTQITPFTATLPILFQVAQSTPSASSLSFGDEQGVRATFGYRIGEDWGLEGSFFILPHKTFSFSNATGAGLDTQTFPTPFANQTFVIVPGGTSAAPPQLVQSIPIFVQATSTATLLGQATTELWGAELNARCLKCQFGSLTVDWLAGGRYIDLKETISSTDTVNLGPGNFPPNSTLVQLTSPFTGSFTDSIRAHNQFFGPQVGVAFDVCFDCGVYFSGWGKVAIGDMHENFKLTGVTQQNLANAPSVVPGGLFVAPADNGHSFVFDRICAVPELNINLGYQFCSSFRVFVGYDFLYLSTVGRPGSQITTTTTNAAISVGGASVPISLLQPAFHNQGTDMFVQGVNMGLEIRY